MTIEEKLQALRNEWPTATPERRRFILLQADHLKNWQLHCKDQQELNQIVSEAQELFKLPIDSHS